MKLQSFHLSLPLEWRIWRISGAFPTLLHSSFTLPAVACLAQLFDQHDDPTLFGSFPGAGPALAPRLLAAFGSNRDRFQGASEMQELSGIAPVTAVSRFE